MIEFAFENKDTGTGFQPDDREDACRLREDGQGFAVAQKEAARGGILLCYTLSKEVEHHQYKGSLK